MKTQRYIIRISLVATLLFVHLTNITRANESNWPQFRGPDSLGIAPDNETYPNQLDISENLLWKIGVPKGHSSPCIWGDNIFITAYEDGKLETICIDRIKGQIKWRKSVEPESLEKINGSNSHASPTPVCDGERVYVYFGSYGLLAYDMEGNELWRKSVPNHNILYGTAASPVLTSNMLVINCDSRKGAFILAVNKDTGETIWKQDRQINRDSWATPVLWKHGNEQELVVRGGNNLISYDLKNGRKRWWLFNLPNGAATTPVYAGDTLFVTAAAGRTGDPVNPIELPDFKELLEMYDGDKDGRLVQTEIPEDLVSEYRYGPGMAGVKEDFKKIDTDQDDTISEAEWNKVAIDTKKISPWQLDALIAIHSGGKDDISRSHVQWRAYEGIGQVPSSLFYKGRIYLVKHGGNVTCYDAKTGNKIYGDKTGVRAYYFASPVAADDKIYFCSLLGDVFVMQAGDKFKILAQNKINERIYATPALVDGNIYLRTDRNMYAFFTKGESVQTKPDIVVREDDRQSKTLYEAAASGDMESVKALISSGADVNTPNDWGWTPLYGAAIVGHGDVVDLLISKGADINIRNNNGLTPLHFTARDGQKNVVELLISKGADIEAKNNNGRTPLHLAALNGQVDVAEILIAKGANKEAKNNGGLTPLHFAARNGYENVVELLIEKGADIKAKNNRGQTPLNLAAINGQIDIVEMLLAKGADFADSIAQDSNGRTPLGLAQENGNTEFVELIRKLANQSGYNKEIMTIYDYAAIGDIEKVKSLISEGINVNTKAQSGVTALHWASYKGHREIVELLIQNGADVNIQISSGETSLDLAKQNGHPEIVELLKKHGAKE